MSNEVKISSPIEANVSIRRNLYTYPQFRQAVKLFIKSQGYTITGACKRFGIHRQTFYTLVHRKGDASVKPLVNLLRNMGFRVTLYVQVDRRPVANTRVRPFIHKRFAKQAEANGRLSRRRIREQRHWSEN